MSTVAAEIAGQSRVGLVRELFQTARSARRARIEMWQRAYKLVHNRAWAAGRSSWMPSPAASEIYPIVAAIVAWMTDQRMTIEFSPAAEPHSPHFQMIQTLTRDLEAVVKANLKATEADAEIEKMLFDGCIYGTGFMKTSWDASLADGAGDGVLERVDPFRFYPDPAATSLKNANYLIEARTMTLQELDRRFPGSADLAGEAPLEAGTLDVREDELGGHRAPMANINGLNGGGPRFGQVGGAGDRVPSQNFADVLTVYECWIREHEVFVDDEGDDHVEDEWRVILTTANRVLMEERAIDLWGHGRHPYSRYVPMDIGEMWGISLVDHLAPLQLSLNRILAAIQNNTELAGNPIFIDDKRSGISRTQITSRAGQRVTKNTGATAEWLVPPPLPPQMQQLVAFFIGEMERISGLSAIVRGASPTGRNAQGVIDSVQEAAFVRIRNSLRNLERVMRDAGGLLASLIAENYTSPRLVAVLGDGGQQTSLFLKGRHFYATTADNTELEPLRFAVNVDAGAAMPTSRSARSAEADALFALGALDVPGLLEAHDYPHAQDIARRIVEQTATGTFAPPGRRAAARR